MTVIGEVGLLAANAQKALYMVIGLPPSFNGGVKLTVTLPSPAVNTPMVGASGTLAAIAIENGCVACAPTPLLASSVPVDAGPTTVGMPLITPVLLFRLSPAGRVPDCNAKLGAGVPVAVMAWL